jgi:hypothetical protein
MILLVIYYGKKTIGGNSIDHLTSAKETTDGGYILGGSVLLEYLEKTQTQEEMIIG